MHTFLDGGRLNPPNPPFWLRHCVARGSLRQLILLSSSGQNVLCLYVSDIAALNADVFTIALRLVKNDTTMLGLGLELCRT